MRLGSVLVVGQVALSLVLLLAAGLFLRSLDHAGQVDLGFEAENVASMTFDVSTAGLYGVMALQVVHRTREIGIRMALGAGARRVLTGVVKRGLGLAAVGLVLGTGIGLLATRVMGSFLLGVSPHDPLTFGVVLLVLAAVAVLASLVPAVRAALIDPVRTLKAE